MNKQQILIIFLLSVVTLSKVSIENMPANFIPKDQSQYVNYLKLMLGQHEQTTEISDGLSQIIATQRPSLINSADKIVILIVLSTSTNSISGERSIELVGNTLLSMINQNKQQVVVKILATSDEGAIQTQIQKLQSQSIIVNVLRGDKKDISRLTSKIEQSKRSSSSKRRLSEYEAIAASQSNGTYLIKFFFSLLFIFVIIGCIGFITKNDGKKDTLLYAKFIADVQSR